MYANIIHFVISGYMYFYSYSIFINNTLFNILNIALCNLRNFKILLYFFICIFLFSGKTVLATSFETCTKVLVRCSTVFMLDIHAEMHQ